MAVLSDFELNVLKVAILAEDLGLVLCIREDKTLAPVEVTEEGRAHLKKITN